mmetsp:Transcript_35945/g.92576  ORF Transcript_35945/g.92576 Transcript_35945/m.92576 type:complete len:103 (+) Transcript_35945:613-921(+)
MLVGVGALFVAGGVTLEGDEPLLKLCHIGSAAWAYAWPPRKCCGVGSGIEWARGTTKMAGAPITALPGFAAAFHAGTVSFAMGPAAGRGIDPKAGTIPLECA